MTAARTSSNAACCIDSDTVVPAARAWALGRPVPGTRFGLLRESSVEAPDAELCARLAEDGYIFLRGLLPAAAVETARGAILQRLLEVDEVALPADRAIATGRSRRRELNPDLGRFWQSVSEEAALRRLTHGPELAGLAGRLFGEPARAQDYLFLRCAGPGKATGIHCDSPFFTRMTERVVTGWCALGPVPLEEGPLFVLAGSHRDESVLARFRGFDLMRERDRKATYGEDATTLAERHGWRVLSADFEPGDVLLFGMFTLHGAFDNRSPSGRVRISCDLRLQPAGDPLDPRYFGPDPTGTTGAGYGELNAARPMTEDWHVR